MSPMGRPKSDNPKESRIAMRVDAEMQRKLEACMRELHMTKSEVLRAGVEELYKQLQQKK